MKISVKGRNDAVGPYSPAVRIGNTLYCSGQIALDASGNAVTSSVGDAVRVIMSGLEDILSSGGMTLNDIVKVTVFARSMDYFAEFNTVYASYFSEPYPARSFVEVSGLPKNAMIEIEAVAVKND